MGQGWIFAHRSMLECAELKGNPFALAVWVHLLLRASHRPAKLRFREQVVAVERGQILTSLRQIEADTGVPLQRLRTILRKFASAEMLKINTVGNTAATVITVCKYDEYQAIGHEANTEPNAASTQCQHSTNTQNKNGRMKEEDSDSSLRSESDAPKPKRTRKLNLGTRLPDTWEPTEADRAYARDKGFTDVEIDRAAENFRNYWIARPGRDGFKCDWSATWRNRILQILDHGGGPARRAGGDGGGGNGNRRAGDRPAGRVAQSLEVLRRRGSLAGQPVH